MYVQHRWLDDDDEAPEDAYEGVPCPACTAMHFLNRKTGKLLGQDSELIAIQCCTCNPSN
jgi:hypothetical protein